jgi:hypothetical protein
MYKKKFYPDWVCPDCNMNCFGSKDKCFKCGCFRSRGLRGESKLSGLPKLKPGDWICSCGEMNFSKRNVCRKCGSSKITPVDKQSDKIDCGICCEQPADTAIIKCGHLAMCQLCALGLNKCPVCREPYTKNDLKKIYISV